MEEKVNVVWKGNREVWVGKNRFYLTKDSIIYATIVGEQDEKTAIAFDETTKKLVKTVKGKVNIFIDSNEARKASSGARKLYKELTEDEKIGKIAIYGIHPVAKVIASFLISVSKKKDMRFFKTREDALAWLKEGD